MKPFAFRQRVGHVNWKAITSVDIETVVDDNQIEELQSIVDDVTFCEIKSADIKSSSIQDTKKLIHLMQLMLEYLLYCQESQLQLIREMHARNSALKRKNKELVAKNESCREDLRIYRRQLSVLKTSLEKYKDLVHKGEGYVEAPPRAFNALDSRPTLQQQQQPNTENAVAPIVESMLRHERQTREFVREMMEEQRSALSRELDRIASRPTASGGERSVEEQLSACMDQLARRLEGVVDRGQRGEKERVGDYEASRKHERAEAEARLRKLAAREQKLREGERELQDRLHDLEIQRSEYETKAAPLGTKPVLPKPECRTVGVNTPPAPTVDEPPSSLSRGVEAALGMLTRMQNKSTQGRVAQAFNIWKGALLSHHAQAAAAASRTAKELLQARSEAEMLREKLTVLTAQLNEEKEKRLIESSRYNTLKSRVEEEKRAASIAPDTATVNTSTTSLPKIAVPYTGPTEAQMMADAMLRVQARITELDPIDIVDIIAEELLDRTEGQVDDADSEETDGMKY